MQILCQLMFKTALVQNLPTTICMKNTPSA